MYSYLTLANVIALVVLTLIAGFGWTILAMIWTGKINLCHLLSEPNGDASMSRFQLLIFIFVIAGSFFLIVAHTDRFPDPIPQGVLLLLGISSSSYLVSKGIQFSREEGVTSQKPVVQVTPALSSNVAQGATVLFTATTTGGASDEVTWSLDPPTAGTITSTGPRTALYTAPLNMSGTQVQVIAARKVDPSQKDSAVVVLG